MRVLLRLGGKRTEGAHAQCATLPLNLLKIGALIIRVREVRVSLAGGYSCVALFHQVYAQLRAASRPC